MTHDKPPDLRAALWRHFFPDTDVDQANVELHEMIEDDPRLVAQFAIVLDPNANSGDTSQLTGVSIDIIEELWSELIEQRLKYIRKLTNFAKDSTENRIKGDAHGIRTVGYMYALAMHRGVRRSGETAVAHVLTVDEMTREDLSKGGFDDLRLDAESLASLGHDGWEEFIENRANDDRPLNMIASLLSDAKIMTPLDVALILHEFGVERGSDIEVSAVEGLIAITKTRDHRSGDIIDETKYHNLIASHHNPAVTVRKSKDLAHNIFTHEREITENDKIPRYFRLVGSSPSNPARLWGAHEVFDAELRALRRYVTWASRQDVKTFLHKIKIPTPDVNDRINLLKGMVPTQQE